jgi:hypothetical protein
MPLAPARPVAVDATIAAITETEIKREIERQAGPR